jgi:hypothetical protein
MQTVDEILILLWSCRQRLLYLFFRDIASSLFFNAARAEGIDLPAGVF